MSEKLARIWGKLLGFWNQYSKTQKWVLASAAAFLILAVIILTYLFTRTQYELAFQNLDSTDSQAIMDYLDSSGVPYKLEDGGSSISVPSASADRVKVAIGSQGLVQNGSIGFAELSKNTSSIGTTDQEFKVKYRNALNGEVQQLLLGMQGIQRAKVLVNLPEESVFLNDEDKERASASIQLTFKPGFRPKQEEVDSYFNLVKTAIPNLSVDDITITSQSGELSPSASIGGTGSGISGTLLDQQFEIQRKFESDIKTKTEQFLAQIVGMDNVVVSVVSSLNFDQKTQQEQIVKPLDNNDNKGAVTSEQNSSQSSTGSESSVGGVAGTGQTDVANYPASSGTTGSSSESTSSSVTYENGHVTTNTTFAPYQVNDLAISVAVDASAMTPEKQQAIQQKLVNDVRTLLANSGKNLPDDEIAKRVSVISQSFATTPAGTSSTEASTYWLAGLGVLALALLGGGFYAYRRRKASREAALAVEEPARSELPTIDIDSVTSESQVRKQLEGLAKRKPDEFVNLLRTWLVDE